jgi:tetratricopeptide (TPR) repeat protein
MGIALYNTGRPAEAVEQFEEALRINPNFTVARSHLQAAQEQMRKDQMAKDQAADDSVETR